MTEQWRRRRTVTGRRFAGRPAAEHGAASRSRRMRSLTATRALAVVASAVGISGAMSTGSAGAVTSSPLTWSAPLLVDHQPPGAAQNVLLSVSCPSTQFCAAVDEAGNVVTSTDPTGSASSWKVTDVDSYRNGGLFGVSCPSTKLCVAVDLAGDVVTSTDPTGGASAWKVATVDAGNYLDAVSCPSTRLCVVIDEWVMSSPRRIR